jgi:hypothetical protein
MKMSWMVFSGLMAFSGAALADWYDVGKVTRIHTGHGTAEYGKYFLFSTARQIQVPGCDNNYGYMVDENITSANRIYSTLLMAYASGKEIAIFTTGRCAPGNRPEVNAIQIRDVNYF